MKRALAAIFLAVAFPCATFAETTPRGKIKFTQGHVVANCRTVAFVENATGAERWFRIQHTGEKDDVAAVLLTALITGRDVTIYYEPNQTTGCGTEPRVIYVTIY